MKSVQVSIARPVRLIVNTMNANKHQWAKIVDSRTGRVLHTGQLPYIRRVAKKKFNVISGL